MDSSTIKIIWTLYKKAYSIFGSLYLSSNGKLLDTITMSGESREAFVVRAIPNVEYTVMIQASYNDGSSATGTLNVMTTY